MSLQLTRLSPALGAVVEGIDLARPLDDERRRALSEALLRHQVLFFRGQDITPLQQRNFAVRFGDLHTHPIYPQHPDAREIMVLDTDAVDLQDNAVWHTDVTFIETPPLGAVLAARQLPELGGDTLWASGIAAYEALSASLKARLDGLSAVHDFAKSFPLARYGLTDDDRRRWDETRRKHPPISHPLVRIHPESGRRALFVSEASPSPSTTCRKPRARRCCNSCSPTNPGRSFRYVGAGSRATWRFGTIAAPSITRWTITGRRGG